MVKALPEAARERLNLDVAVSWWCVPKGRRAEAGIRARDIITRLDNKPVDSLESFQEIANALPRGRSVSVFDRSRRAASFRAVEGTRVTAITGSQRVPNGFPTGPHRFPTESPKGSRRVPAGPRAGLRRSGKAIAALA